MTFIIYGLTVDDAMPHGNKNKRQSLDHEFFLNSLYFCVKFVFGLDKSDGVGTFCNDLNCQLLQLATYPWGSPWRGKGSINKKLSVLLRCHPPDFSRRSMPQRRSKKWRGYPKLEKEGRQVWLQPRQGARLEARLCCSALTTAARHWRAGRWEERTIL
jgi:hypothetical protein